MRLTRLDFHVFRGTETSIDTSSYIAFNPVQGPGSLVLAGACAARESISGQVACRLSLEHFVSGVEQFFVDESENGTVNKTTESDAILDQDKTGSEVSVAILEAAFKKANSSVYSFGHKLAVGGRMAASLVGLVIEDQLVAAGRVGGGSAYLVRGTELFPFFEGSNGSADHKADDDYVGAHSLVSVELASVPLQSNDRVYVFSRNLNSDEESCLLDVNHTLEIDSDNPCDVVSNSLFSVPGEIPFSFFTHIGPETIYLNKVAAAS